MEQADTGKVTGQEAKPFPDITTEVTRKPHNYNAEIDVLQVEALAQRGLPLYTIAAALGVSKSTLDRRRKEDDGAIDAAYERGRGKGVSIIANKLFEKAMNEGDLGAMIFFLKTKGGFLEKQLIHHEGGIEGPRPVLLLPPAMTMEDWEKEAGKLRDRQRNFTVEDLERFANGDGMGTPTGSEARVVSASREPNTVS